MITTHCDRIVQPRIRNSTRSNNDMSLALNERRDRAATQTWISEASDYRQFRILKPTRGRSNEVFQHVAMQSFPAMLAAQLRQSQPRGVLTAACLRSQRSQGPRAVCLVQCTPLIRAGRHTGSRSAPALRASDSSHQTYRTDGQLIAPDRFSAKVCLTLGDSARL